MIILTITEDTDMQRRKSCENRYWNYVIYKPRNTQPASSYQTLDE